MERVRELIHRIGAQEAAQESPAAMLATARALAAELEALVPRPVITTSKSVVVLLPLTHPPTPSQREGEQALPATNSQGVEALKANTEDELSQAIHKAKEDARPEELHPEGSGPNPKPQTLTQEPQNPKTPEPPASPEPYFIKPPVQQTFFNPIEEVPTLTQQTPAAEPAKEVFELHTPGESLHDRLRRDESEVAHKHSDAPIRDLRKGVALNDRYLFVSELFRGDEAMYERSIKTINAFHILPEAEYWINRELKVKLGWDDSLPTVQHFYGLVRRRFS
ncbi:MAG: hypothetical protein EOO15_11145 [Chitinophagaceae bacterium]|nr:MAG: hypothetical protein EOO15_11145 [Chitinophagaceae bacterium]